MKPDFELINLEIGGIAIKDMTAITFLGWVARQLNGIEGASPARNELVLLVSRPPLGQLPLEEKVAIIRKLEKLGIVI